MDKNPEYQIIIICGSFHEQGNPKPEPKKHGWVYRSAWVQNESVNQLTVIVKYGKLMVELYGRDRIEETFQNSKPGFSIFKECDDFSVKVQGTYGKWGSFIQTIFIHRIKVSKPSGVQ